MQYYKIDVDIEQPGNKICHYGNDYGMSLNMFSHGKEEKKLDNRFFFYYNDKEEGSMLQ